MVDAQWPEDSKRADAIHRGRRFTVYRVRGKGDETIVVKTPRPDRPPPDAETLRHEYQILRRLPVPGVCQPLALEEEDEHPALLLEDAGPIDLDHFVDQRPVDLPTFHLLARQLSRTLARIHRAGIVHLDIAPPNIVLDPERETATLVDFDIATSISEPDKSPDGTIAHHAGLPYLAPEQTGALDREIDERADLYALGGTFYRMLTGAPPASANDTEPVFVPPSSINPEVPSSLDEIVACLLADPPEERYSRAESLLADLQRTERSLREAAAGPTRTREMFREGARGTLILARDRVQAALARAQKGARAMCIVTGAPGTGKSLLASSLRADVEAAGGRFLLAACGGSGGRAPITGAFAETLRAILREPEKSRALVRHRLRITLGIRAEWLAAELPVLAELLELDRPVRRRVDLAPEGDLCTSFCDLADGLCPPDHPLALVVDDLDRASPRTLRLLKGLIFAPASRHWLVLGVLRTGALAPRTGLAETVAAMRAADPFLTWIDLDGAGAPLARPEARRFATASTDVAAQRSAHRDTGGGAKRHRAAIDKAATLLVPLDWRQTLEQIPRVFVPDLADLCTLDLIDDEGELRRAAALDDDPAKQSILDKIADFERDRRSPRLLVPTSDLEQTIALPSVGEALVRNSAVSPEHERLLRALAITSVLALPLRVEGRCVGRAHLARRRAEGYARHERSTAEDLARLSGLALHRARRYEAVQQDVKLRDEFLSIAAHELSTPVTSLKLSIDGIRSGTIPATPDNLVRTFRIADRQVRRLAQLIGELLSVSRIRAGTFELAIERVDLASLVREVVERFEEEAFQSGSSITLNAAEAIEGMWDRNRLDQVVTNLLSNAIKFGRGRPIEVSVEGDAEAARLSVRDRGIGIAPEKAPSVFERFVRGVPSRQYGGLGLGLYIVAQIVETLGGKLDVQSEPEQGSTFIVELPREGPEQSKQKGAG